MTEALLHEKITRLFSFPELSEFSDITENEVGMVLDERCEGLGNIVLDELHREVRRDFPLNKIIGTNQAEYAERKKRAKALVTGDPSANFMEVKSLVNQVYDRELRTKGRAAQSDEEKKLQSANDFFKNIGRSNPTPESESTRV